MTGKFNLFIRVLKRRPDFMLGYIIVFLIIIIAIFAPLFAPFDPIKSDAKNYLKSPQWPYLMGTDATGMDVFSRVLYAPRVDLAIALLGTLLSAVLGVSLGAIAGFTMAREKLQVLVQLLLCGALTSCKRFRFCICYCSCCGIRSKYSKSCMAIALLTLQFT